MVMARWPDFRNRWFTELKHGGSFHGELFNNQMVVSFFDFSEDSDNNL